MNKYLEKVAAAFGTKQYRGFSSIYDTLQRRVPNNHLVGTTIGATLGGSAGAVAGYNKKDELGRKPSRSQRVNNAIFHGAIDGVIGGLAGRSISRSRRDIKILNRTDRMVNKAYDNQAKEAEKRYYEFRDRNRRYYEQQQQQRQKQYEDFFKDFGKGHNSGSSGSSSGGKSNYGFRNSTGSIHDILNDLEAPAGGFKTKAEATKHFKRMSMKHHPDRGGDVEKMKKINTAFDKFKAHPDGFEKLAGLNNIYLDYIL